MSRFTINLTKPPGEENSSSQQSGRDVFAINQPVAAPKKSGVFKKLLAGFGIVLLLILGGGFFYWQTVKKTPEYSLALLVDAARREDQKQIDELIDAEAVIGDFMPQVTAKAVELYGRNLPPSIISKVELAAAPIIPIVRERAKLELPRVIREKTEPVKQVPYWMIALFANRAVDITIEGDTAIVKSRDANQPLEVKMKRAGDRWKITGMKDEVLARKIAEKIGQDIIAAASRGGIRRTAEQLGVKNIDDIKNAVEGIFK